jgi:hypothetical protein
MSLLLLFHLLFSLSLSLSLSLFLLYYFLSKPTAPNLLFMNSAAAAAASRLDDPNHKGEKQV